ncbi:MAG: DNA topoisomerase IB [Candidatus Woesebacteria bacterium]|nr:MAG: DNA topoisomerase IB [Candidatus Woesebacteria bacterium]
MPQIDKDLTHNLKKADLRYVTDTQMGITRKKNGHFKYFDTHQKLIKTSATLKRIESLSIPPAWKNVWICPSPSGYLQATGLDSKSRKQYIYHPEWTKVSQEKKFNKVVFFGYALPTIRNKVYKDMLIEDLIKDKIIATVIWLLEHTFIRIGNEEYVKDNNSFGLTTLRSRHVKVRGKNIKFQFRGKSGVEQSISITHPRIAKIIKECSQLPGYEIFQYFDEGGERHAINSEDVNEYLKSITGEYITAKDFRTWGATVLCATSLKEIGPSKGEIEEKKNISSAVKKVSSHLHNTAKVCKNYYIHPTVFETYQKNILVPHFNRIFGQKNSKNKGLAKSEYATLTLIRSYS